MKLSSNRYSDAFSLGLGLGLGLLRSLANNEIFELLLITKYFSFVNTFHPLDRLYVIVVMSCAAILIGEILYDIQGDRDYSTKHSEYSTRIKER